MRRGPASHLPLVVPAVAVSCAVRSVCRAAPAPGPGWERLQQLRVNRVQRTRDMRDLGRHGGGASLAGSLAALAAARAPAHHGGSSSKEALVVVTPTGHAQPGL
eukprot:gene765-7294_t